MKRNRSAAWHLALLVLVAGAAVALDCRAAMRGDGWRRSPAITVIARAGDPRVPVVEEAVEHWNRTLERLGTPFRLGPITQQVGSVPDEDLKALSAQTLERRWVKNRVSGLDRFSGDLLVVLSDASFISFTSRLGDRTLVAIKSGRLLPLTLPNV